MFGLASSMVRPLLASHVLVCKAECRVDVLLDLSIMLSWLAREAIIIHPALRTSERFLTPSAATKTHPLQPSLRQAAAAMESISRISGLLETGLVPRSLKIVQPPLTPSSTRPHAGSSQRCISGRASKNSQALAGTADQEIAGQSERARGSRWPATSHCRTDECKVPYREELC